MSDIPPALRQFMQELPALPDDRADGFLVIAVPRGQIALAFTLGRELDARTGQDATDIEVQAWMLGSAAHSGQRPMERFVAGVLETLAESVRDGLDGTGAG